MTQPGIPTFDPEHLAQACGDDLDVQREIVLDFLSRLDERLEEIAAAVASQGTGAIRNAAHTLKGAAASLGAPALADASARLESLGRTGALEGATDVLRQVRHEAARLREALAGFPRDRAA